MRLLLDTHALLWWLFGDRRLSAPAREAIGDPATTVLVSAASVFEIATKHRLGKLAQADVVASDPVRHVREQGFDALSISLEHAHRAGQLPAVHRDPFDRLLIAQALTEAVPLVSNEALFDTYGCERLW